MTGGLTFHVLGPVEVRRSDGSLIDLGGPQPRQVLSRLLLAEGRIVSTDALLTALWGETPPESAIGTLQTYVSRLRKALGPDGAKLLRYESSGYRLAATVDQVDARQFDQLAVHGSRLLAAGETAEAAGVLRQALDLWTGGDDESVTLPRWQERRLIAEEDLFDAGLRLGRAAAIVADLADAVARSPLRERLRGLLALALYRSGRQAEALAALEEGRRLLGEELGLDLSRELRQLQSRILDQDATLDVPDRAASVEEPAPQVEPAAAAPGKEPAGSPELPHRRLIGRRAELTILRSTLAEVLSGTGWRAVVIEGEPGMGKTTLGQEIIRQAEVGGSASLTAGTLENGAAPAYGPWLQLARAARQRRPDVTGLGSELFGESDLTRLEAAPAAAAALIADNVADMLSVVAGDRGLVVLLEDLQWADPASLDLLSGLASRLTAAPVLCVTTVRELEVGRDDAVVETLAQLTRQVGTRRIRLRGLSWTESRELIRLTARQVPDAVVTAVHSRSEGNPFFTTELARMMGEEGDLDGLSAARAPVPSGVRDVLQRRVSRLPPSTRQLLEVAAVLGREVDVGLVAAVADRPLDDCLDDLEPALIARLLEMPSAAPGTIRFAHALVREALADGLSPLRRARLHLRAADGILAAVGETDDTAEIVAEHLWHAAAVGASARAAEALEKAAQVALKRQALVSAESLLTRAAGLYRAAATQGGRAELRVLRQIGFVGAALHGYSVNADSPLIHRARELARSTDQVDTLLDLIWADWAGCDTGGQPARAHRLVDEAEALVDQVDNPLLQGAVASMRGFSERHFGRMASAYAYSNRAVQSFSVAAVAQEAGFYLNGFITTLGFRHWAGTLTRGLDRAALEHEYQSQDMSFGRMVIALFGSAATLAADDQAGLALFAQRMMAADPDMVLSFWSASAELYTAVSMLQRGDVEVGLTLLAQGTEHMRRSGGRTMMAGLFAAAAQALVQAGRLNEAAIALADARVELAEAGELAYEPVVELAAAHLEAALGNRARAAELFDLAHRIATEHGSLGLAERIERERMAFEGQAA